LTEPTYDRRASLILGTGMVALALLCAWIAWEGLSQLWRGVQTGANEVTVPTGAAAGIAVIVVLLAAAAMLLPSHSPPPRTRLLFGTMLAATPLLVLLPLALTTGSRTVLEERGYARCDTPYGGQRFQSQRWCRVNR
jgi:ACR3 family arsenite efflux pump ArsB